MRGRLIIALFLVIIFGGAAWFCVPDFRSKSDAAARVKWYDFNRDAVGVMNQVGFSVQGVSSMGNETIPVPLITRIISWCRRESSALPANEIEPHTLRIVAQRHERAPIRCLARYHKGYIAVIVLRFNRRDREDAVALKKALMAVYPTEQFRMEEERE